MKREKILEKIKGQLIVSCQALPEEPLYNKDFSLMPYLAKAAIQGGAKGIRSNSARDVIAIKEVLDVPVIGIIKKQYEGGEQYITVSMKEIDALVEAKTDIIALDCTLRDRYDGKSINEFVAEIKGKYPDIVLMADISNLEEAINAEKIGIDMVGTTLNGYTEYTANDVGPNIALLKSMVEQLNIPVIAEGRIHTPEQAKEILDLGVHSIVVGGAITRPLEITQRFIERMGL